MERITTVSSPIEDAEAHTESTPESGWAQRPLNRRSMLKNAATIGGSLAAFAVLGRAATPAEAASKKIAYSPITGAATAKITAAQALLPTTSSQPGVLFTGLQGAGGCRYRLSRDQLVFVTFVSGELLAYPVHGPLTVLVRGGTGPGGTPLYTPRFRGIRGTGYTQPEDVALSADDMHVYVTERTGNLLRVSLNSPNRGDASVVSSGMTAPQQIALDEGNHRALVVEYAAAGRLLSIDLSTGAQTTLVSGLDHAVGVALTSDGHYAYVSEQAAGGGKVSRFDLTAGGARTTIATGFTAPFFLTWSDASETRLYMTDRDPVNSAVVIDLSSTPGVVTTLFSALPFRPSCVAVLTPDRLLVTSDSVISDLRLLGYTTTSPLLLGIGFVPFNKIVGGLATTDPGYFFQVQNAPFGGQLPLMVNHPRAVAQGINFYKVLVDGVEQNETWSDYLLDSSGNFVLQTITSVSGNFYAIRPASQTWYNPYLGFFVDSLGLSNGLHTIRLQLYGSASGPSLGQQNLVVLIDNNRCTASVAAPLLNGVPADPDCGVLTYTADGSGHPAGTVTMAFTASQPNNHATYSFSLLRGVTPVGLVSQSGAVNTVVSPISPAPAAYQLLGTCPIAGFAESVYVAATAIDGWSRQSQYDASAQIAFVLAPASCGA